MAAMTLCSCAEKPAVQKVDIRPADPRSAAASMAILRNQEFRRKMGIKSELTESQKGYVARGLLNKSEAEAAQKMRNSVRKADADRFWGKAAARQGLKTEAAIAAMSSEKRRQYKQLHNQYKPDRKAPDAK